MAAFERMISMYSVERFVGGLVGEKSNSSDELLRSPFAFGVALMTLLHRFDLLRVSGEAGVLRDRLLDGLTTPLEIFQLRVDRQPKLDVRSWDDLKDAEPPPSTGHRYRDPGDENSSELGSTPRDPHVALAYVLRFVGSNSGADDELLRSSFAVGVAGSVLSRRLGLDDRGPTG